MISCVDDYFMITQLEKCIPFPFSSSNYFTNSLIYLSVFPFLVSGQTLPSKPQAASNSDKSKAPNKPAGSKKPAKPGTKQGNIMSFFKKI
jgi:hypothetical protein